MIGCMSELYRDSGQPEFREVQDFQGWEFEVFRGFWDV